MSDNAFEVERRIEELRSTGFFEKYGVKAELVEIESLPYNNLDELRNDIISGKSIVRRYPGGINRGVFSILSSKTEQSIMFVVPVLCFLGAISGIGLAIFYESWFWLLLLALPFVAMSIGKRIYDRALFGVLLDSERAFCFAFCAPAITLETSDGKIHSWGQQPL